MMRNGMFTDLIWDNLGLKHHEHWEILRNRYNISTDMLKIPVSLDDLAQQCVEVCHEHLFSSWLMQYQWAGKEEMHRGWKPWEPDEALRAENLQDSLMPALCDHLIVTFAHQFYCENLEPKKFSECEKELFACRALYSQDGDVNDLDFKNENLSLFRRQTRRAFAKYCNNIPNIVAEYREQVLNCQMEGSHTAFHLGMEQFNSYLKKNNSGLEAALITKDAIEWQNTRIAAPDWIFTLTMAYGWKNSPFKFSDRNPGIPIFDDPGRDWLTRIYDFLVKDPLLPLLIKGQTGSKPICHIPYVPTEREKKRIEQMDIRTLSTLELRTVSTTTQVADSDTDFEYIGIQKILDLSLKFAKDIVSIDASHNPPDLIEKLNLLLFNADNVPASNLKLQYPKKFVAIAYNADKEYIKALPKQAYNVKNSKKSVEISTDLQYIFNNYLLERNFHGYAIECLLDHMFEFFSGKPQDDGINYGPLYHQLTIIFRLRAPLVHAALIQVMDQVIYNVYRSRDGKQKNVLWLSQYLDYWNAIALPLLEELFLQGIKKYYPAFEQVHQEIEKSIMDGGREDCRSSRLNLYRTIPAAEKALHRKPGALLKTQSSPIILGSYMSSAGYRTNGQSGELLFHPGCCTAFE